LLIEFQVSAGGASANYLLSEPQPQMEVTVMGRAIVLLRCCQSLSLLIFYRSPKGTT